MGLACLAEVAERLAAAGKQPSKPAAVISRGTQADEEVMTRLMSGIAARAEGLEPPALVVVDPVVGLRGRLGRASRAPVSVSAG